MPRTQCEQCGAEFANEYKLFRHERECSAGSEGEESTGDNGEENTTRPEGTVKTFFKEDGYGFIVTADVTSESSHGTAHTEDVFVHISDTDAGDLEEGDRLRFNIVENEEGLQAKNATRIQRSSDRTKQDGRRRDIETARSMGFGNQVDDTKYGRETGPTEQEITDFKDNRKFR
jgi:cold shock CspA family protein